MLTMEKINFYKVFTSNKDETFIMLKVQYMKHKSTQQERQKIYKATTDKI